MFILNKHKCESIAMEAWKHWWHQQRNARTWHSQVCTNLKIINLKQIQQWNTHLILKLLFMFLFCPCHSNCNNVALKLSMLSLHTNPLDFKLMSMTQSPPHAADLKGWSKAIFLQLERQQWNTNTNGSWEDQKCTLPQQ